MSVFKMGELESGIRALQRRLTKRMRCSLTHEELLELIVPPEKHDAYRMLSAEGVTERSNDYFTLPWEVTPEGYPPTTAMCCFTVSVDSKWVVGGNQGYILPQIKEVQGQPSALTDRIEAWLTSRTQIGLDFARVMAVVERINDACTNGRQVRYLFPSILVILKESGLEGMAAKFAPLKVPGSVPTFEPSFRVAMRTAAATVTSMSFLGDADGVDTSLDGPVTLALTASPAVLSDEMQLRPLY